jgi:hypothetical protein
MKIYGWTTEMVYLSHELSKSCLETVPEEDGEERKRENLKKCIKAILLDDDNAPKEIEKKWDIYTKPIMEDTEGKNHNPNSSDPERSAERLDYGKHLRGATRERPLSKGYASE